MMNSNSWGEYNTELFLTTQEVEPCERLFGPTSALLLFGMGKMPCSSLGETLGSAYLRGIHQRVLGMLGGVEKLQHFNTI
jgi:hypothetical protein